MLERYRLPQPSGVAALPRTHDRRAGRSGHMPGMMVVVTDQDTGNDTNDQPTEQPIDDTGQAAIDAAEAVSDTADDAPAGRQSGPRRRIDKTVVIVILLVGIGIALVGRGLLVGITGDERANLPELIEQLDPVPDSVQVLSQSNIFVDLATGYTGVLVIDGLEIETINVDELRSVEIKPGEQIDLPPVTIFEPGNSTLTFSPSDNAAISEFTEGLHRATVIYWRVEDGRQRSRSFTWTFNVI
jgi:hypothetical protein